MQKYPKISIITPVKNAETTIEKTIQSIINQSYPNLEYIIIDGNSTDKTMSVINKYKKHISKIIQENSDTVTASNNGIKLATGEIIALINSDDFYQGNILHKIAAEFNKNKDLDIVSCLYQTTQIKNNNHVIIDTSTQERMSLNKNKIIKDYGINARFFKKSLFDKYGPMLEKDDKNRSFISNDVEHLTRIVLKGVKEKTINFIGYNYLSHPNSATFSQKNKIQLSEDKIFIARHFLNSENIELPKIWRKTFKKWLLKYNTKIILQHIKNKNFATALHQTKNSIKDNGSIKAICYIIKNLPRILSKKI